ncbi:16S rRNA (adenine(1518)-N(6)/adenine(1519)-N(6))-dimethyltransferase RsmA [Arboricoccus pini]|nr:16S rRNA (adenine(1518)-N(6)/adenine(1519)-N(6))-dimethyltransferase RsmA [Arboricoccus pini]
MTLPLTPSTRSAEPDLPPLREVIRHYGLRADKKLGQHFLTDPNILGRIVASAGDLAGKVVVEVGPGPGGLTRFILRAAPRRLTVIEQDRRCLAALHDLDGFFPGVIKIIEGDARRQDTGTLAGGDKLILISNLPYNVGTELLLGWLGELDVFERLVLMFQKEVALRLTSRPGEDAWGRLAVLAQTLCDVERLFDLPASAFVPPPKVESSVVRFDPRPDRPAQAFTVQLGRVTQAAFGQRRKMLRSALRTLLPEPELLLEEAGIMSTRRAEELSLAEFHNLTRLYMQRLDGRP